MRVLVTGATGLLGNNLVRLLLNDGVEVRAMSPSARHSKALSSLDVERVEADIRDAAAVARATEKVDAVFHCAGCVKIGWSDHVEHEAINHSGARNVADALRGRDVRLVHVSSVNALGIAWPDRNGTEEDFDERITPCPYVTSKRAAQDYVANQVDTADLDAVTVLPGFLLGPWDWKPSSGQILLSVAEHYTPFVPTGGVSLADVRDVARGTVAAFHRGRTGRRYILAGHNLSYRELWKMMAKTTGTHCPIFPLGPINRWLAGVGIDMRHRLTGREPLVNSASLSLSSMRTCFSSQRAIDELGYRFRPAEEAVEDAWDWLRRHQFAPEPARQKTVRYGKTA
ncbi:MAG: NAD-dependent epimerase/dehydratase family protein [Pirellulaceae bacterium]|nr:NAD-dependent epimerase/dehydratase family protein [Pirellulaceae bacterium]